MSNKTTRDEFSPKTKEAIAKRAAFICSNPDCRSLTLGPSGSDPRKFIYTGRAAHITAASPSGPRYDPTLTPEERSSVENAIYLCPNCADMVDKNDGIDFSVELLRKWKSEHEKWIMENQHSNPFEAQDVTILDGTHVAEGLGDIIGIDVEAPVIFKPGTRSTARGVGNVTGTRIGRNQETD